MHVYEGDITDLALAPLVVYLREGDITDPTPGPSPTGAGNQRRWPKGRAIISNEV